MRCQRVACTSRGAASPARSAVCQAARFSVVVDSACRASSASRHSAKPRSAARCGEQAQRHRAEALARVVVAQAGRLGDELRAARRRRRRTDRAGARRASSRRAARAWPRPGSRVGEAVFICLLKPVQAVALGSVAGPADVGELHPAGAGAVELVLRVALHEQQRAGVRLRRGRTAARGCRHGSRAPRPATRRAPCCAMQPAPTGIFERSCSATER